MVATTMPGSTAELELLRVRADNPGPMTLTGTNSYVLRGDAGSIVIDPGPADSAHADALIDAAGTVALVLVTHRHRDHTEGIDELHERTGAPVRAMLAEHCRGAHPLVAGERLRVAGAELRVIGTPGHTSDSVSFHLPAATALFTGDTILGGVTTVLDFPDGTLSDYLHTLDALIDLGERAATAILPGHGEPIDDLATEARRLRGHRLSRLADVTAAANQLGEGATAEAIVDLVYRDAPASVRPAAIHSVEAQLAHLRHGAQMGE